MFFVAIFLVTIFQCSPRAKAWNPEIEGKCINISALLLVVGVFNSASDLLMLIFPVYCIWHLRMTMKRKLGISALFFIGSLYATDRSLFLDHLTNKKSSACAASILRLAYSIIDLESPDVTFTLTQIGLCT